MSYVKNILIIGLVFCNVFMILYSIDSEPIIYKKIIQCPSNITDVELRQSLEIDSPSDWIKEKDIAVYDDKFCVYVDDPYYYAPIGTNSMDPVLDETMHSLGIAVSNKSHISPGDIIVYNDSDAVNVVHRVKSVGYDSLGWYAIAKGDNNPVEDYNKVRFSQVESVVVAVVY